MGGSGDGDDGSNQLEGYYESSPRVFGKYDVTSVPLVFHIAPDFGSDFEDVDTFEENENDNVEETTKE